MIGRSISDADDASGRRRQTAIAAIGTATALETFYYDAAGQSFQRPIRPVSPDRP